LYESVKSLDTIFEQKSYEDITKLLNTHYLGNTEEAPKKQTVAAQEEDEYVSVSKPSSSKVQESSDDEFEEDSVNDRIKDILADL
jgi:hypothetical protein